ncbi:MAG: MBL fold metallo-hydrolase [Proteobacteria bacterium]|nr:MBL fold metallo-hydrolase [Pseudomonadota bacterium]
MTVKNRIILLGTTRELDRSMNLIDLSFLGPGKEFLESAGVDSGWYEQYPREKEFFTLKDKQGEPFHLDRLVFCREFGHPLPNQWSVERVKNMSFVIRDLETGESCELDISPDENETIKPVWEPPPYYGGFPAALAFSLQVLGYGSPFQSKGPTTCMVFRLNGLAVLVDCCPFWDLLAVKTGISIAEIDSLILTHCHEDHMGGLLKLIRRGRKIRIYTVKDIFQMMLNILS